MSKEDRSRQLAEQYADRQLEAHRSFGYRTSPHWKGQSSHRRVDYQDQQVHDRSGLLGLWLDHYIQAVKPLTDHIAELEERIAKLENGSQAENPDGRE